MTTRLFNGHWVTYSSMLMSLGLVASMYYNGYQPYLFALCWFALFLVGVYQSILVQRVTVNVDVTILILVFFVSWLVMSLYWHPLLWRGVEYNWRAMIFVFVLFVTVFLMRDRDIESVQNSFLFVAFLIGILSLWQLFFLGDAPSGAFINKNNNAALLNLFLLPLVSMFLFGGHKAKSTLYLYAIFVLMLFVVLQVGSRGALLSFMLVTLVMIALAVIKSRFKGVFSVAVLVLLAIIFHQLFSDTELRAHLQTPSRWFLFKSTIEMIRDMEWYGAGNGMFRHLYYAYRAIEDRSSGSFVHNDYLQLLLELGMPGFILLVTFAGLLTYKMYLILTRGNSRDDFSIYLGMYAGLVAVAIHSMVTFNFYQAGILLVCGFYAGLILRRSYQLNLYAIKIIAINLHSKHSLFTMFVLGFFLVKSVILPGYADAVSTAKIDPELYTRSVSERIEVYNNLRRYDPRNSKYPMWVGSLMFESGRKEALDKRMEIYKKARELFSEAKELNRYSPVVYAKEAYHLKQYRDVIGDDWHLEVISIAGRALLLEPRLTRVRLLIAETLVDKGNKNEALSLLLDGLEYSSNQDMRFYEYGKELASQLGDVEAEDHFQHAIETHPDAPK